MKRGIIILAIAALVVPAFAEQVMTPINQAIMQAPSGARGAIPAYDPLARGAISLPGGYRDADQFECLAPSTGFMMDGFSLAWGQLIVPTTELITYGAMRVSLYPLNNPDDPVTDICNGTSIVDFDFAIGTEYYPPYTGYYNVYSGSVDLDPADYVWIPTNKLWWVYEFRICPDQTVPFGTPGSANEFYDFNWALSTNEFTTAHADWDISSDIGTNLDYGFWYGQDGFPCFWSHFWFGATGPNGDLYGDISRVPEPASLLLIGLAGLLIRRR